MNDVAFIELRAPVQDEGADLACDGNNGDLVWARQDDLQSGPPNAAASSRATRRLSPLPNVMTASEIGMG